MARQAKRKKELTCGSTLTTNEESLRILARIIARFHVAQIQSRSDGNADNGDETHQSTGEGR